MTTPWPGPQTPAFFSPKIRPKSNQKTPQNDCLKKPVKQKEGQKPVKRGSKEGQKPADGPFLQKSGCNVFPRARTTSAGSENVIPGTD
jgi:hypothetical protein